ncbi:MAG: hypothetical protein M3O70_05560 [Actinomycetota bacterium]|nr:hypothetical protein [Actinomycetota bacterium]
MTSSTAAVCTVSRVASARHGLGRRGIDSLVRASVYYYNTSNELERLVSAIDAMAQKGRRPAELGG